MLETWDKTRSCRAHTPHAQCAICQSSTLIFIVEIRKIVEMLLSCRYPGDVSQKKKSLCTRKIWTANTYIILDTLHILIRFRRASYFCQWINTASSQTVYCASQSLFRKCLLSLLIHILVVCMSRNSCIWYIMLWVSATKRHGYDSQQRGTICDACGSFLSIWSTLKPAFFFAKFDWFIMLMSQSVA